MSILSILGLGAGSRMQPGVRTEPTVDATARAYPSVDPGLRAKPVEDILAAHEDLISRIKLCYGADRAGFEADLLTPIRNYAAFVNLLPATPDNFFCEIGGLFRLGLEVAFYALQGTDGHIVSGRATISTRRQLEPRWRHATFIAGLCSELHRTLSQVVVTDERGQEWPAYLGPLSEWLERRRARLFFVRWLANAQESRALGLFALPHIVSPATMQHLATANTIAVPQMLSCLAGTALYREQNILVDLVKRAAALVIDRDLIACANRYGRPILGAHLERYLIDAMRRLVASHAAWAPNHERSRVWYGREGLFIVWPNAVNEIRKLLEEDELPGIPKAPDTILEILLGAGVFERRSTGSPLWTIEPPPGKTILEAVKLAAPEILLHGHGQAVTPLSTPLVSRADAATASGLPPASAALAPDPATPAPAATEAPPADGTITPGTDLLGDPLTGPAAGPDPEHDSPGVEALPEAPADAAAAVAPVFRLVAPLRLNPMVRDALAAAIASMNGDSRAADAITVSAGVFVPLEVFKRRHIDIPVALRSLAETGMTATCGTARAGTVQHDMGGKPEHGFVIRADFVEGLDPSDFAPSV
ncbi:MAG: TraI domain-containing protein [Betaproteobacteria bacterium]|jgi:conjugal transfer pilus assembly protein TraI|nr:TraI domain-containing protein [Betaproteobacteria bacterium]